MDSDLNIFNNFYATYNIYVYDFTTIILFIEYFYSACNRSYTERIYIGIIKYMYIYIIMECNIDFNIKIPTKLYRISFCYNIDTNSP